MGQLWKPLEGDPEDLVFRQWCLLISESALDASQSLGYLAEYERRAKVPPEEELAAISRFLHLLREATKRDDERYKNILRQAYNLAHAPFLYLTEGDSLPSAIEDLCLLIEKVQDNPLVIGARQLNQLHAFSGFLDEMIH